MRNRTRRPTFLSALARAVALRAGAISVTIGIMCLVALAFILDVYAGIAAMAIGLIAMGIDWPRKEGKP